MQEWMTWGEYIEKSPQLSSEKKILELLKPVMTELQQLHKAGKNYGMVTPENILVKKKIQTCFSAKANQKQKMAVKWKSSQTKLREGKSVVVTNAVKPYLPLEYYFGKEYICAQSDIYGLSTVIYRAVTGKEPQCVPERCCKSDQLANAGEFTWMFPTKGKQLQQGISLKISDRQKSMDEFLAVSAVSSLNTAKTVSSSSLMTSSSTVSLAKPASVTTSAKPVTLNTGSVLMASNDDYVFGNRQITRDKISEITFSDMNKGYRRSAVKFWDVSEKRDGSVMAWTETKEDRTLHLYIAGRGGVRANKNCHSLFDKYSNLETIHGMEYFDTSLTTTMSFMFFCCSKLKELDVSHFDTSQVTDMSDMFNGCANLTKLDVTHFNTEKVTDTHWMFRQCGRLTKLDVSHFNTSQVKNMESMFEGCSLLTELNVNSFDTGVVTSMANMFAYCSGLKRLDLRRFKTSRVKNMRSMFFYCKNLQEVDVSSFDTSQVIDVRWMFFGCVSLNKLDISKFNISRTAQSDQMLDPAIKQVIQ